MPARAVLTGVTLNRGTREVLRDVSLTVPADGLTAIVGPSGAGKSSLLRLLVRFEEASAGTVLVDGRDVREHDPLALRRRIGLVAQTPVMLEGTVADNLAYGLSLAGASPPGEAVLRRAGLDASFLERRAGGLSGGEAIRVAIARALAHDPAALLLDEPTAALDGATRDGLAEQLAALAAAGTTVVVVTHDETLAHRLATYAVRLAEGRVAAEGSPAEVLG